MIDEREYWGEPSEGENGQRAARNRGESSTAVGSGHHAKACQEQRDESNKKREKVGQIAAGKNVSPEGWAV